MLRSKTLLLFLAKACVIYFLLSLPLDFYDTTYRSVYKGLAESFFGNFRENGFIKFRPMPQPAILHANIGNVALIQPDGTSKTTATDINTRYLGYMPSILLIALVLASPVSWKRRLMALGAGLVLVTLLVMFKQWISFLWLCEQNPFLQLTDYGPTGKKYLAFLNTFICVTSSSVLYFVVAIWLLVTFRVRDFKTEQAKG